MFLGYAQCLPTGVAGTYSTYPTTTKPLTSTLTRTFSWPASTAALPTQSCATQRNSYIITRDDPSDFYFVTQLPNGVARLVNTRPAGDYTYRQLATTIATTCTPKRYLSVYELATTSYKPLVWTAEPHTDYWDVGVVGNLSGKLYISTSGASQYGFKWDFLACGPDKVLYLQTGTQVPPGVTCISVHLNIEVFGSP
ncbi:hypothetical protein FRC03_010963 [Tulasnella sp. 419]|nr:hypothetical protein FRC03_010963 [Tulasnella sp. 419]